MSAVGWSQPNRAPQPPAATPTTRRVSDASKHTQQTVTPSRPDSLAPPILVGATYVLVYVLGAIDASVDPDMLGPRLRYNLIWYEGVSIAGLAYLFAGYALFTLGFYARLGTPPAATPHNETHRYNPRRASWLTTILFLSLFGFLLLYTLQQGYGRFQGSGQTGLENLSLLGEMSIVPFGLGLYRFMLDKGNRLSTISRWDTWFLWLVMFPCQVGFSVFTGTRSRLLGILIMVLAAYHYGHQQLRPRSLLLVTFAIVTLFMPGIALLRTDAASRPDVNLGFIWESMMDRTSALEGFTIAFEHPDDTPEPDPLYQVFVSGLVPRLIWPDKPLSTWGERFTLWATGQPVTWASPGLPGELLLDFGYAGGLLAMLMLGILWRRLFLWLGSPSGEASGFIYIVLLPVLLQTEVGFVSPYSMLLRLLAVSTVVYLLVREVPTINADSV